MQSTATDIWAINTVNYQSKIPLSLRDRGVESFGTGFLIALDEALSL